MFDVVLNCLDNDDRIIDDEPDSEDEPKERQRVNRKPKRGKNDERAD